MIAFILVAIKTIGVAMIAFGGLLTLIFIISLGEFMLKQEETDESNRDRG